jgi:hypothetical protein
MKKIMMVAVCFFAFFSNVAMSDNLSDSNKLFDWAEQNYPQFFYKTGEITFTNGIYLVRYYKSTNIYIGTHQNDVYVYGDIWKGLLYVGKISNFINTGTQDIVYKVGDIGPAGGIVFSVEASGLHGLESQKTDYSNGLRFNWQYAMNISNIYGSDWRLPIVDPDFQTIA